MPETAPDNKEIKLLTGGCKHIKIYKEEDIVGHVADVLRLHWRCAKCAVIGIKIVPREDILSYFIDIFPNQEGRDNESQQSFLKKCKTYFHIDPDKGIK